MEFNVEAALGTLLITYFLYWVWLGHVAGLHKAAWDFKILSCLLGHLVPRLIIAAGVGMGFGLLLA